MKNHGPWQITGTREVYRDPWIELTRDDVIRPDGKPGTHCVLRMKHGVSVLPIDSEQNVYLTDEFHYGIGRQGIEVASGGIETGEDPLASAQRELREELGIAAGKWDDLGTVDPFTTIVVSSSRLYLARELTFGSTELEGTEQIHCLKIPLAEAVQMVMDSRITHGPSCVLILKARLLLTSK